LVNDAPTTVAAKFQRWLPQETPQHPTMGRRTAQRCLPQASTKFCRKNAAAANDRRRRKCRNRVPQKKTAPKTHPKKTGF
jgi:hypothetical protein